MEKRQGLPRFFKGLVAFLPWFFKGLAPCLPWFFEGLRFLRGFTEPAEDRAGGGFGKLVHLLSPCSPYNPWLKKGAHAEK